jgi:hypothetical protein
MRHALPFHFFKTFLHKLLFDLLQGHWKWTKQVNPPMLLRPSILTVKNVFESFASITKVTLPAN